MYTQGLQVATARLSTRYAFIIVRFSCNLHVLILGLGHLINFVFVWKCSVKTERGDIDLNSLLSTLNWRENPVQHPKGSEERTSQKDSEFTSLDSQNLEINYQELIKRCNEWSTWDKTNELNVFFNYHFHLNFKVFHFIHSTKRKLIFGFWKIKKKIFFLSLLLLL